MRSSGRRSARSQAAVSAAVVALLLEAGAPVEAVQLLHGGGDFELGIAQLPQQFRNGRDLQVELDKWVLQLVGRQRIGQ